MSLPPAAAGQEERETLQGEFGVTIATEDIPPDLVNGPTLIGRWQIVFTADGSYRLERQDVGLVASGHFETDGGRVTLSGETGLLACVPAAGEETATYEWAIAEDRLQLVAITEPCAVRRHLLTTRTLATSVACPAPALRRTGAAASTPAVERVRPPNAAATAEIPQPQAVPEAAIDDVLRQMSACWATRQPDHFLPLLSEDFRAELAPDGDDAARRFTLTMAAPLVWELAGEVEVVDPTRATATVRQISGDEVDFVQYVFVFEDGAWRWDGEDDS
jgi:hypothetical protein